MTKIFQILLGISMVAQPALGAVRSYKPEKNLGPSEPLVVRDPVRLIQDDDVILSPKISVSNFTDLSLMNGRAPVDYSGFISGFPSVHLSLSSRIFHVSRFSFAPIGSIGFATKSGFRGAGGDGSLMWLPFSAGIRTEFYIPGFRFIRPSLTLGGGVHGFRQRIGGNSQFDWVPFVMVEPALSFFSYDEGWAWFRGFTFGTTVHTQLGRANQVRGISFDLSVNLAL